MRILYIWDADYPWDVRVEKICMTLKKNGHEAHIAARNLKKQSEYEIINGLHIHRLKKWRNGKVNYAYSFPAFFSPVWRRFLDGIIQNKKIDLIIVRDLPMAIAGIWAGKRNKIPVIFDMAEDYVALIKAVWKARKFQGLNLIVRNPYLANLLERYVFKTADHILVVVKEAEEVVLKGGVKKDKITIIGNTPPLDMVYENRLDKNKELELIDKRYSAIYVGGIQLGRGLQVVLEALPEIKKKIPDFLFVIVGAGYATEQLKGIIAEKGLDDFVFWAGWIEHEKIYNYIKGCNIGLIPHFVNDHKNTTVPNKLFDYMKFGLPVVASNAVPLKRILTEEKCGLTFKSGDSDSLAKAVGEVYESENDYGVNGQTAITNKYNWENEETKLLQVIEKVG